MRVDSVTGHHGDDKSWGGHSLKNTPVALLPDVPHDISSHPIKFTSSVLVDRLGGRNPPRNSVIVVREIDLSKDVEIVVAEDSMPHLASEGERRKICVPVSRGSVQREQPGVCGQPVTTRLSAMRILF